MGVRREMVCKEIFPKRRKNAFKSMEAWSHGSFQETVSKTEWLEPKEVETGGWGQIMYYLVHHAQSMGAFLEFHSL